jgi:fructose-bisphosphate aldolase class II
LEILNEAKAKKYGVGAFNLGNLEFIQAIASAVEEERSPAIIAASPGAMKYFGPENLRAIVGIFANKTDIPVSLHLDHSKDFDSILVALRAGFTSVMIDGSALEFQDNLKISKKVVEVAHPLGVSVEAELGHIESITETTTERDRETVLTDPKEAKEFVETTGIDALAVAIGTAHGAYKFKGKPLLAFDRLKEISEVVDVPLVLHGASGVSETIVKRGAKAGAQWKGATGVPDSDIQKAVALGISKINIATDLRLAFTCGVREYLLEHREVFKPDDYLIAGRDSVKEVVIGKMRLFSSSGKA